MDNSNFVSLSRASMLERQTEIIANNIANASTPGFQSSNSIFGSLVEHSSPAGQSKPSGVDKISYPIERGTYTDLTPGELTRTESPLDLAVRGSAFLGFQMADGQIAYGRNGQLARTVTGELVSATGQPVVDAGGAPIVLPLDLTTPIVSQDGQISDQQGNIVAQIGIFATPDNVENWSRNVGGVLVPPAGTAAPLAPADPQTSILQGFIEDSNVSPITQMTQLISAQRAFEQAMKVDTELNDLQTNTLKTVGSSL